MLDNFRSELPPLAKQPDYPCGTWLLAEELLEQGDVAFVDELRKICDADKLAAFARLRTAVVC